MSLQIHVQRLALGAQTLIGPLQIDVPAGTVHTIMGASGSGKSSLLAAVCGTLGDGFVWDGQVTLDGTPVDTLPTSRRRVGILFQDDLLFAHMTVRREPAFRRAARAGGPAPAARGHSRPRADLELELPDFATCRSRHTLGRPARPGGADARTAGTEPQALLLDEPFSRLDGPGCAARLREFVIAHACVQRRIPALLVTHDAADVADPTRLTRL
jgi:putative thiamine transport system ATP-binding protein